MPSSKSSLDKRDVYYRKGKSDGVELWSTDGPGPRLGRLDALQWGMLRYRARSAYKLLHLDEEFDLFRGVRTAVDLCAAPGSWSQVLGQRLKPSTASPACTRVVSVDLQPMAPLPGITTLQADITIPETVSRVLSALGGRKADLVVCDGAPDVTGVHDLDAYLHSQLLLAALTLSLTLMAPGATLIFKIFLSPLDPSAALLRSQLRSFFPGPPPGAHNDDVGDYDDCAEFDDTRTLFDGSAAAGVPDDATRSSWGPGYDAFGRPGGVWVRKPRSSRKGSGEAFIIARNFDPSTLLLPAEFSPAALAALRDRMGETLTLESLVHLSTDSLPVTDSWSATKAFVEGGNLGSGPTDNDTTHGRNKTLSVSVPPAKDRQGSLGSIDGAPSPVEADTLFGSPTTLSPTSHIHTHATDGIRAPAPVPAFSNHTRLRSTSDTMRPVTAPVPLPTPAPGLFDTLSPVLSWSPHDAHYPPALAPRSTAGEASWASSQFLPLPGSPSLGGLSAREREIIGSTPHGDGAVSPAGSSSSKTDAFFSTSQRDNLPVPPPPLPTAAALGRASSIGRGMPPIARTRVVTTPATPLEGSIATSPTSPVFSRTPLRSVTGPGMDMGGESSSPPSPPSGVASTRPCVSPSTSLRTTRVPLKPEPHLIAREECHGDETEVPLHAGDVLVPVDDESLPIRSATDPGQWRLIKPLGRGAFAVVWAAECVGTSQYSTKSDVVAVKMVDRSTCVTYQRTAISFYREVEVLRHLVHPGIVGYIAHFSTTSHNCLLLERLGGGELFSLMANHANQSRMMTAGPGDPDGYGFIRRVFGELCRAVAWLHEVEVVHRDIKLENILFTINPFELPPTTTGSIPLDRLPVPLVKLSDFGLSRFIRSSSPLLTTRCGSEAYAAPEVVMGNLYDGRRTDAWALGIVLYALVTGELPFEDGAPPPPGRARAGSSASTVSSAGGDGPRESRRRTMHRIAKGAYGWHEGVGSPGVRHVVSRLLTRDPVKRARVAQLWNEDWMRSGAGAVPPPTEPMPLDSTATGRTRNGSLRRGLSAELDPAVPEIPRRASDVPHVFVAGGVLVDHERIDKVALQDPTASG